MTRSGSAVVGVIGAGRMGLPIIGHLAKAGHRVLVHDVDPGRQLPVEACGAVFSESAAVLASQCEVILICVGYDQEVQELVSQQGLLRHMRPDSILALLATLTPSTVHEVAAAARSVGVHVADTTVCRGGRAADTGTLLSFVGGERHVFERLQPVLQSYSTDVLHTGGHGSAQVAKAANNLVMWACLVADHEALALAARYGLDIEALRRALMISTAHNDVLNHWGTNEMVWADKDLEIVGAMAEQKGMRLRNSELVREICRELRPKRYRVEEYGSAD